MGLTQPLTRPLTSPLTRAITAEGGGGGRIPLPAGFDWTPPVNVYRDGASYRTDYNAADWIPATTAEIWVSTAGNDTTGNGTQGNPWRSINKGLTEAAASAEAGVHLRVVAGFYELGMRWQATGPDKNMRITAEGGPVISSTHANITWTLQGSGAYRATRTLAQWVYDTTNLDAHGNPTPLTLVADEATCGATPNSWYTDGSFVYVNTFDSRVPANTSVKVILSSTNGRYSVNKNWYVNGFIFEGSSTVDPFYAQTTAAHTASIVFEDCVFRFGNRTGNRNGLGVSGINQAVVVNCESYYSGGDGFNYHDDATNGISPKVVEIGCTAYGNGAADGTNNDNGSTLHEACRALRVNCVAAGNYGPQFTDIDTSQSFNVGCEAGESASTASNVSNAGFYVSAGQMWLYDCTATGSDYATVATTDGELRYRRGTLTGSTSGDVAAY